MGFIIDKAYQIGPNGSNKMVVDYERDVWLQWIGSMHDIDARQETKIFALVWKGRRVHVIAQLKKGEREDLIGRPYSEWYILAVGGGGRILL